MSILNTKLDNFIILFKYVLFCFICTPNAF